MSFSLRFLRIKILKFLPLSSACTGQKSSISYQELDVLHTVVGDLMQQKVPYNYLITGVVRLDRQAEVYISLQVKDTISPKVLVDTFLYKYQTAQIVVDAVNIKAYYRRTPLQATAIVLPYIEAAGQILIIYTSIFRVSS